MIPSLLIFLGSCIQVISSSDVFGFVILKYELNFTFFFLICSVIFLSQVVINPTRLKINDFKKDYFFVLRCLILKSKIS